MIKKRIITIYESNQDIDRLKELFGDLAGSGLSGDESALTAVIDKAVNYSPVMRFILEDDEKRTFIAICCDTSISSICAMLGTIVYSCILLPIHGVLDSEAISKILGKLLYIAKTNIILKSLKIYTFEIQ